jgi:hypothetical protein
MSSMTAQSMILNTMIAQKHVEHQLTKSYIAEIIDIRHVLPNTI